MLLEIFIEVFFGAIAIFLSIPLLRSGKLWKAGLGLVLMGSGVFFTFNGGNILMAFLGLIPQSLDIKARFAPFFPMAVGAAFIAWLGYVTISFFSRLGVIGILFSAFAYKQTGKEDYLESAKMNALRDQFFWLIMSFVTALIALVIISMAWVSPSLFMSNMELMVIALVWVFVVPPLFIHTSLKKSGEIVAIRGMKNLQALKGERVDDYRELIAVMDEVKDENLKGQLDRIIIDGLSEAIMEDGEMG